MDGENVLHVCADVRLIFGAVVMAEDKASYALIVSGAG
jgi:hypothetical protein